MRSCARRGPVLAALVAAPLAALLALLPAAPVSAGGEPVVIGHRGAAGYRPEHTLASYLLAIRQCADFIEPDLVATRDGVLVARHENEIGSTTDVADHPEFATRRTTKVVDGISTTGWFTEDFTLAELRTLRARERIPGIRPQNAEFDDQFTIPTFREVIDLARRYQTCDGGPVGIYPETKHPSYFRSIGLPLEGRLVDALEDNGFLDEHAPVIIQSFEVGNLRRLADLTHVRLAQLVNCTGRPWDFTVSGDPRTYADLVRPAGLDFIRSYADVVAVCKDLLIPVGSDGRLGPPTPVIADAHARCLPVHAWTFRRENLFLPPSLRSSADPAAPGDLVTEIRTFLRAGVDGVFTDNPDIGAQAVDQPSPK
jgi:glycerophosphoryl diester phosphodiesterase